MKRMSCASTDSIEQGIGVGLGVEGNEVVNLLPGDDKANGEAKLTRDGHDDAAFGGTVQLREDDAGYAHRGGELARLRETILSGGCIKNKQNIVRRAGDDLGGGAL